MFPQGMVPSGDSYETIPFMAARICLSTLSCDPYFPVLKVSHASLCLPYLSSYGDYVFQVRYPTPPPQILAMLPGSSGQSRITSLPLPPSFDHICRVLVTIQRLHCKFLGIRMWVWEPLFSLPRELLFSLPQFLTTARSTLPACIPQCCEAQFCCFAINTLWLCLGPEDSTSPSNHSLPLGVVMLVLISPFLGSFL